MAYWTIRCSEEWLAPIYDRIREELLKCEVLHMDETRIQCNKEEGRKASTDSFMWVIRSAASEAVQAAYFHYFLSRSTETARNLLDSYSGYLITDAYSGYNKAGIYKRSLCWAHCRRYFIESIPLDSKGKEIPGSKGADGRIPLSNNLCEANIKPFATARRAWLFADTPKGARANAILYTIVETAKAIHLDVYEYLKYLLEQMPNNDHLGDPGVLEQCFPWSKKLPDCCRLAVKNKKCFKK